MIQSRNPNDRVDETESGVHGEILLKKQTFWLYMVNRVLETNRDELADEVTLLIRNLRGHSSDDVVKYHLKKTKYGTCLSKNFILQLSEKTNIL